MNVSVQESYTMVAKCKERPRSKKSGCASEILAAKIELKGWKETRSCITDANWSKRARLWNNTREHSTTAWQQLLPVETLL